MAKMPYKATLLQRATVKRESRLVLSKEINAPENSYRLVQILTPMPMFIGFADMGDPADHAGGRDYDMLHIPGGFGTIAPFVMLPDQELYVMAASTPGTDHASLVFASLIVQYWQRVPHPAAVA